MTATLIAREKNRVSLRLAFTAEELREACGSAPTAQAVLTAVKTEGKEQLQRMGLHTMADPEVDLNGEQLSAVVTALCLPALTQADYQGLPLREPEKYGSEQEREERIWIQLLEELMKRVDFDLPEFMYENEVRQLVSGLFQQMRYDAMAQGKILDTVGPQAEEYIRQAQEAAVWEIKRDILIDALLKAVPVEVTGKDLQAEGEAIAQRQNTTLDEVRNLFGKDLAQRPAGEEGIEITVGLGGKNDIKGTKRLSPWAYTSPRQDVLAICQLIAFWETALTVANEERGKEKPVAYPGPFGALASISVLRCAGMHGIG